MNALERWYIPPHAGICSGKTDLGPGRTSLGSSGWLRTVFAWLQLVLVLFPLLTYAQPSSFSPIEVVDQSWRVVSFLDDAGLEDRFIMQVDIDAAGTVWLATSNGLFAYDGYTWKRYGEEDGLPSNFVRSVLAARDGTLWVGTDNGVASFDGTSFSLLSEAEELAGSNIRRIVEDAAGTLWFCSDKWLKPDSPSGLTAYRQGTWTVYREADGLPSDYVSDYFRDSQGRQFVLTAKGLAQKEGDRWVRPLEAEQLPGYDQYFWSIVEAPGIGVIAATGEAFFILKDNRWSRLANTTPGLLLPKLLTTQDGQILTVTSWPFQFHQWTDAGFEPVSSPIEAPRGGIEYLKEEPDGSIWAVGHRLLVRWNRAESEWTAYRNLPPPQFADKQGTVWFADEERIVVYRDETWSTMPDWHGRLVLSGDSTLWLWSDEGIARTTANGLQSYAEAETGLQTPTGYTLDREGKIWFHGTDTQGRNVTTQFDGTAWHPLAPATLQQGTIMRSQADPSSGVWYLVYDEPFAPSHLVHVDKTSSKQIRIPPNTQLGVPAVYIDQQGQFWLYGEMGLATLETTGWKQVEGLRGRHVYGVMGMNESLWIMNSGFLGGQSSLSRYTNQQWTHFDIQVTGIAGHGPNGTTLIIGRDALYMITPTHDREPVRLSLPANENVLSALRDPNGNLWVEAEGSVLLYQPDRIPPETQIHAVDKNVFEGTPLPVTFEGLEQFKPRNAGDFLFTWRIDDGPWSDYAPSPEDGLPVEAVENGKHTLEVRAWDEGHDIDPTPARLVFTVYAPPLQERWWFWPAIIGLMALITTLGATAFWSRHKLSYYAEHLEALVNVRTAALKESEEQYRQIVDTIQDGIWMLDTEGRTLFANRRMADMLGYHPDEMIGRPVFDFMDEASREAARQSLQRRQHGMVEQFDFKYLRRDGSFLWTIVSTCPIYDGDGAYRGALGVITDITERKQAEDHLKQAEKRYRELFEDAPVMYVITENREGTPFIIDCNALFLETLGFRSDEVLERPLADFYTPESRADLLEKDGYRHALDGTFGAEERHLRAKNGKVVEVLLHAVPELDAEGRAWGTRAMYVDIAARKRAEESLQHYSEHLEEIVEERTQELKDAQQQLLRQEKLAVLGQLAGGVGHELRNPLGIIANAAYFLKLTHPDADETTREYLHIINDEVHQSEHIVSSLIDYARDHLAQREPVEINAIVAQVLERYPPPETVRVHRQVPSDVPPVLADPAHIEQVMSNLIANAYQAMEEGGTLVVRAEQTDRGEVAIQVKDTGSGIAREALPRVFEPLYTTKARGIGLGLAVTKNLVEANGGRIAVESIEGQGAVFTVTLKS